MIRALNEEQHIGRLLAGLEQQAMRPDRVVLVDSGSADATVDIARHFGVEVVRIDKHQFTFGRSLNLGMEACQTDLVLLLSAHVYPVYRSHVGRLLAPFADPTVAVSYGRQVGDERTHFSEARVMRKWFPPVGTGIQTHPFTNNANAAVRRQVWEQLRYDEDLTGLEDLDFAKRAQSQGHDVAYVAEAPVVHVHQEPWATVRNRFKREAMAYAQINDGWRLSALEASGLGLTNVLADFTHASLEGQLLRNLASIPAFRTAQFLGAWEGARAHGQISAALRQRFYYPSAVAGHDEFDSLGDPIQYSEGEA